MVEEIIISAQIQNFHFFNSGYSVVLRPPTYFQETDDRYVESYIVHL